MKNNLYKKAGSVALALAISGLPAIVAYAQDNVGASATISTDQAGSGTSTTLRVRGGEEESQTENQGEATTSVGEAAREVTKQQGEQVREQAKQIREQAREMVKNRLEFDLEDATTSVLSFDQLQQSIEQRKQELDDEEASTTPDLHDVVKNANEVRLAVHTLLASKDLLGGIGQQVSEIAKQMNDSVATTTDAEAHIQSRGFFTRLLFGGDTAAANVISNEVAQDQQNIAKLTDLLNQASTTPEVKAVLTAQIDAMQAQITRLQDVATSQAKLWGLFSWRF